MDNLLTKPFVRLGDRLPRFSSVVVVSTVLTQPRFCKKRQKSGWSSSNAHPPPLADPHAEGRDSNPPMITDPWLRWWLFHTSWESCS